MAGLRWLQLFHERFQVDSDSFSVVSGSFKFLVLISTVTEWLFHYVVDVVCF